MELLIQVGATPTQTALAWLLTQGNDIAPSPATRRVARAEENTAAENVALSANQLNRLNDLTLASGDRRSKPNMPPIDQ